MDLGEIFSASGIDRIGLPICVSASRISFSKEIVCRQAEFTEFAKKADFYQNLELFWIFLRFLFKGVVCVAGKYTHDIQCHVYLMDIFSKHKISRTTQPIRMSDSAFDRILALLFGEIRAKSADHILVSKSHLKVAVCYQEKSS